MHCKSPTEHEIAHLRVEGHLTIGTAIAWKARILNALREHARVRLDLSSVTDMDTAGMALLITAKREAARQHRELHFHAQSPANEEMIGLFNIAAYVAEPPLANAEPARGWQG